MQHHPPHFDGHLERGAGKEGDRFRRMGWNIRPRIAHHRFALRFHDTIPARVVMILVEFALGTIVATYYL